MPSNPLRLNAILVTADLREVPLWVTAPVPHTFSIHRADGRDLIFRLQRTPALDAAPVILYVEDATIPAPPRA